MELGGGGIRGMEVGTWVGLVMGLNSRGEGVWIKDSKLLVGGMHSVNGRTSLNWLFGVF